MESYKEYAMFLGIFGTSIHTRINREYKITSTYRRFSNDNFEKWGWETFLWNGEIIDHQYGILDSAEDVVSLHSRISKVYLQQGIFYKED